MPASTVLMGNINPSDPMVLGDPGQVTDAVRRVIEAAERTAEGCRNINLQASIPPADGVIRDCSRLGI